MSERTVVRPLSVLLLGTMFLFSPALRAQTSSEEPEGTDAGNYHIQQTAEFGYRQTWIDGNQDTYQTFVGLNNGARLLDYTLSMRSLDHQGLLFDNLNFSNYGYGGDPDDVSRLRVNKNKWYDFSGTFRRHKNFWDYNLLANPLNPVPIPPLGAPSTFAKTNPGFAATQPDTGIPMSPHSLFLVRRMQDYDLTLLPQSRVRFRLGYSRNVDEGPSLTSLHSGTELLLLQNFRTTSNTYRMGVDFRIIPKTTISFDEFLEYDYVNTIDTLDNTPFTVQEPAGSGAPGTLPVDMGLTWYYPPTATTAPCATPFLTTGFASPTCKDYTSFLRTSPTRNFMPTERLSFQSRYIPRLEMSGAASYSNSDNVVPNLFEFTHGTQRDATAAGGIVSGPAEAKEVFARANWSGIFTLTHKLRLLDSVNYDQWQNPGFNNAVTSTLFPTAPTLAGQTGILLPLTQQFAIPGVPGVSGPAFNSFCTPSAATPNPIGCPQHTASSNADAADAVFSNFLGQRLISNTIQLQADLTKRISARIGFMYQNRQIGEIDSNQINGFSTYYPGGASGTTANAFLAGRGSCKSTSATAYVAPAGCTINGDGSITFQNGASPSVPRTLSTIDEQVGLAGLTLRPIDTLRINADFEFGYNNYSYTRIWPRQIQSYKVHLDYKPRPWATFDAAVDINENRDNVVEVNNLEHGRTYSASLMLAPTSSKFAFNFGFNYTDLYLQTNICFNDTFGSITGPTLPVFPACTISNSPAPLGATEFYAEKQDYAYSDVMWKPTNRVTATLGYSGTFAFGTDRGSTLFLDPLQPEGTIAFNYHKPFASLQIDIYKGLSYKTTWDFYGYDSKTPINTSIPISSTLTGPATYALEPIPSPTFNGSTLMFSLRYAF